MMKAETRPVYFAVLRRHGRDEPQLFYDEVPRALARPGSPLVYCTRLPPSRADDFRGFVLGLLGIGKPTAPVWLFQGQRLARQLAIYQRLKSAGTLPPEDRGAKPKPPEAKTTRQLGQWWTPPAPSWDPWQPFEGWRL